MLSLIPIPNFPHVQPGDDVGQLLIQALANAGIAPQPNDIFAIAQKIISKAENRFVNLQTITPSPRALEVAQTTEKDPRLVELILGESTEISRMRKDVLIVRHRLGFTSANAGIDRSNVPQQPHSETVLLLPQNPDATADNIRQTLENQFHISIGILITDSHGRPFRLGTVGIAIGVSGFPALWDRRGDPDLYGYRLQHTDVAVADEIAAAAGLVMGQAAEGIPIILIRGLNFSHHFGRATDLVRPAAMDLYR